MHRKWLNGIILPFYLETTHHNYGVSDAAHSLEECKYIVLLLELIYIHFILTDFDTVQYQKLVRFKSIYEVEFNVCLKTVIELCLHKCQTAKLLIKNNAF